MNRLSRLLMISASSSALILGAVCAPSPALAQSTWLGIDNNYNATANWNNNTPPVSAGQSAIFAGTGSTSVIVGAAVAPDSLTFNSASQSYAITGNTVTFGGAGLTDSASGKTINIADVLAGTGAGMTMNDSTGTLTLTGANTYTGATTISAGTLALSGSGSIANSSSVSAGGTFDISQTTSGASIKTLSGNGNVNLGAQTLTITAGSTTFSGVIANGGIVAGTGGSLAITGGTQTLSGANTYSGGTTLTGGTLAVGNNSALSFNTVILNGGTLQAAAANLTIANAFTINAAGGTLDSKGQTITLSGNIKDFNSAGTLTITDSSGSGAGKAIFTSSSNGYVGTTVIASGTLQLGNGVTGVSSSLGYGAVTDNGTLAIFTNTGGNYTLANPVSGTGGLTINAPNGTVTNGATDTYSGATLISSGTLSLTGSITTSGGVSDSGAFDISQTTSGASITTLSGGGTVALGGKTLTITGTGGAFSGVIADSGIGGGTGGSLTISGGTETLSGASTYTGSTTISVGTLALSGSGSIATSSGLTDSGTFDISGTTSGASITTLSGAGSVKLGNQTLTISSGSGTFSGLIADGGISAGTGGSLTISGGAQVLSGANTYTGSTSISSGATLALSGTGSIATSSGLTDSGTFDISGTTSGASITTLSGGGTVALGGKTLTMTNVSAPFTGTISDGGIGGGTGGNLSVTGGVALFTAANTYTGVTSIGSGAVLALFGTGSIATSSSVSDAGTFIIAPTTSGASIKSLSGSGSVRLGSQTLTITAGSGTFSGVIADGGGIGVGTGGSLSITGGAEILSGANTYTGTTTIGAGATLQVGAGGTTGSLGSGAVTDNGALVFNRSDSVTVANAVSGSGTLTQSGSGTLILTGSNSYSGGTTIGAGATLQMGTTTGPGNFNDIGTGAVTDNGTLAITTNSGGNQTVANTISGTGGVTINVPNGIVTLSGTDTYSGATTISSGTLAAGNLPNSSVVDNGIFQANGTIVSLSGGGSLSGTLTLSNASGTFSGLLNSPTFTVAAGSEILSIAPTCGCSATVTIASGASLQASGVPLSVTDNGAYTIVLPANTTILYSSPISGSGAVTVASPGSTLSLMAAETYTGATTITAGALALNGAGSIAASSGVADAGTLDISGTTSGASIKALTGAGSVVLGSKTLSITAASGTFSGVISGTGGIATSGSQTLGGVNTYTGATTITSGTLALSGAGSIAASSGVADAGTFDISATTSGASVKSLGGAGGVTLGSRSLTITAASGTLSGAISGSGGVTVIGGSEILSGANTYTGVTTISGGSLQIGAGGISGSVAGNITDNAALVFNRSDTPIYAGVISGTGTLTQAGSGTLILNGVSTYTGATTVSAGTLEIGDGNNLGASIASAVTVNSGATLEGHGSITGAVTVLPGGTLKPGGSIGTLTVNGNLSLPAGTTLSDEVSPSAGSKVAVSGTATLGGTLAIVADPGTYTAGTDYKVLTAANVVGTFSSITGSVPGLTGTVQYSATGVDYIAGTAATTTTTPPPVTTTTPPPVIATYLFNSYGKTPNAIAAGAALTAGSSNGALYVAAGNLVGSNSAAVPGALGQLAGDIHASIRGAAVEDSRLIRDAVINRLVRDEDDTVVWGTAFGGYGSLSTTGNAAGLHHDSEGFVIGADTQVEGGLRLGVAGAFTANKARTADYASSEHGSMGHVIAYAGWSDGHFDLKLGGDAAIGNAHVNRSITALNLSETDRQSQRTAQIFGEAGYRIFTDQAMAEPYLRLADIAASSGSFVETGGSAALSGASKTNNQAYSMLGIRGTLGNFSLGDIAVTPRADIGWQHALNRFLPSQIETLQSSATSFTLQGVPLSTDAAATQIGFDLAVAPQATLSIGYDGSFSSRVQNNGLRAVLDWKLN